MQPYMCDHCGKKLTRKNDYGLKIGYMFPIHKKCFEARRKGEPPKWVEGCL